MIPEKTTKYSFRLVLSAKNNIMTQPTTGARYEITVDGKPRSMRDTKAVAIEAGEYLKSKNPNVEVTGRDLVGGETIIMKSVPSLK